MLLRSDFCGYLSTHYHTGVYQNLDWLTAEIYNFVLMKPERDHIFTVEQDIVWINILNSLPNQLKSENKQLH